MRAEANADVKRSIEVECNGWAVLMHRFSDHADIEGNPQESNYRKAGHCVLLHKSAVNRDSMHARMSSSRIIFQHELNDALIRRSADLTKERADHRGVRADFQNRRCAAVRLCNRKGLRLCNRRRPLPAGSFAIRRPELADRLIWGEAHRPHTMGNS